MEARRVQRIFPQRRAGLVFSASLLYLSEVSLGHLFRLLLPSRPLRERRFWGEDLHELLYLCAEIGGVYG